MWKYLHHLPAYPTIYKFDDGWNDLYKLGFGRDLYGKGIYNDAIEFTLLPGTSFVRL